MRSKFMLCGLVFVLAACGTDDVASPGGELGLSFDLDGRSHVVNGTPSTEPDDLLRSSFAVARADSVGGVVVIGYQRTGENEGNLFVLQAPREPGTYTCSDVFSAPACHGRYVTGVQGFSTSSATRWFHVTAGSLTLTQIGPQRLRGTFGAVLTTNEGIESDTIYVENGVIDVPYVADQITDGSLECLLTLVGVIAGECRGR